MYSSRTSMKSAKGFTLIELLVVIAIIAILAAILFPVFAQAREKARQASCISNTKQIGLAILQYVQDYDESMPSGNWGVAGLGWMGQTYAYSKNAQVYKCPDDITANIAANGANPAKYAASYVYNVNIPIYASALAALNAPANTVLATEIVNDTAEIPINSEWSGAAVTPSNTYRMSAASDGLTRMNYQIANAAAGGPQLETGVIGGYTSHPAAPFPYSIWFLRASQGGRHSDGAVYACGDGHSKWLKNGAVSCGTPAVSATDAPNYGTFAAAGTGGPFQVTFSPN